jgi:REP element-mobilizing transposase RayT
MKYDPDIHHRRSIRLKEYDYSSAGVYFVTICTAGKTCLFGTVEQGIMLLNDYGRIVDEEWHRTGTLRPDITLDAFVVMPNHVHGVIVIHDPRRGTARRAPTSTFGKSIPNSLSTIVGAFKSAATRRINAIRDTIGAPLWHRNYYEHVIRDERDLQAVREYVTLNPMGWDKDEENPVVGARRAVPVPRPAYE